MISKTTMELRTYAERVLFGQTLEDKINGPGLEELLSDLNPGSALASPPDFPGRPGELAFDRRRDHSSQFDARAASSKLSEPRGRGMVLHYFANHELLALEIMALALLRFPDAPAAFRMGIARTMCEEQDHLRQYIARMAELGVRFGDLPVNSFFWRTMKGIASPSEYAAAMSLTFEQANLDFALHYEKIFRDLGDGVTADMMRRIHDDEIRHVEHGVKWMQRFEGGKSLWESYQENLQFPLTPSRAKGPVFDRAGRERAGLDENFIAELKLFSSSKGRPADVWLFNPACEREIAMRSTSPFLQTGPAASIENDLADLLIFVANQEDIALVPRRPSKAYLADLLASGFPIPELIEFDAKKDATPLLSDLGPRKLGRFRPWGQTPAAMEWVRPLERNFTASENKLMQGYGDLFSKEFFATEAGVRICRNAADLTEVAANLTRAGHRYLAVKPALGASGAGLRKLDCDQPLPANIAFPCTAGPWFEKICDLGVLIDVESDGQVRVLDVMRPVIDAGGRYAGHALGRPFTFPSNADENPLGPDFFAAMYPHWIDALRENALQCGKKLAAAGYRGPASIDGLVHRTPGSNQLALQPLLEVNPRLSMGRIALVLERHIARGQPAMWLHINRALIKKSGYGDFSEMALAMKKRFPLQLTGGDSPFIKSGFLATNDPEKAQGTMTALFAGHDASQFAWQLLYAV